MTPGDFRLVVQGAQERHWRACEMLAWAVSYVVAPHVKRSARSRVTPAKLARELPGYVPPEERDPWP